MRPTIVRLRWGWVVWMSDNLGWWCDGDRLGWWTLTPPVIPAPAGESEAR